jgi:hypothetical protein
MQRLTLIVGLLALLACGQASAVRSAPSVGLDPPPATRHPRLSFVAQSDSFADATREYERIWASDGARIVRTMESVAGLTFRDSAITVVVFEGASNSGYRDVPMRMRASYSTDTKKATLVHELGHRLQSGLFRREEEEHGPLFFWLYDTWIELYGREFADAQIEIEKRRGPRYVKAWNEALALTTAERASQWRAILAERLPTRR